MTEARGSSLRTGTSAVGEYERIEQLLSEFGTYRGSEAVEFVGRLADALPFSDASLLDAAAALAARHRGLEGHETRLRGLLGLLTLRGALAGELGTEPHHVFDELEWTVTASARLEGEAIRTIWREPMLKPGAAAVALGARVSNREKVRRLRRRSSLLGVPHGNGFLYPAFQFDSVRLAIFSEVQAVNERLKSSEDPWGVASWWMSQNARLGCRPVDLVGTDRADDLPAVAEAMTEPLG